jgi:hypothetical protein
MEWPRIFFTFAAEPDVPGFSEARFLSQTGRHSGQTLYYSQEPYSACKRKKRQSSSSA